MIHPWRTARSYPSLTIEFVDLPDGRLGTCDPATDTIYLAKGMRQRQRRAVLQHELTHWLRGGVSDTDYLERSEERHVERIASAALVPLDDLINALLWSQDETELADELCVDVATVRDRLKYLSDVDRTFINDEMDRREAQIP